MAATRHYYIAAEDVTWDYAPSHRDLIHAINLPAIWDAKTAFKKTRFIEYTDDTFTTRKSRSRNGWEFWGRSFEPKWETKSSSTFQPQRARPRHPSPWIALWKAR